MFAECLEHVGRIMFGAPWQQKVQILEDSYENVASESPEGLQGMKLSLDASFKFEASLASDLQDAQGERLSP